MRTTIAVSLGLLSALALPIGLSNTNARTPSVPNIRGTCIWQEVKLSTTIGDQQGAGPATILALVHFDGNGGMTMDYDTNINGSYSSTNGVQGYYSIDATGHGSFAFTSPASGYVRTYDFRISPGGRTIYTMAQSDGLGIVAQRVSTGTCAFQEEDRTWDSR